VVEAVRKKEGRERQLQCLCWSGFYEHGKQRVVWGNLEKKNGCREASRGALGNKKEGEVRGDGWGWGEKGEQLNPKLKKPT